MKSLTVLFFLIMTYLNANLLEDLELKCGSDNDAACFGVATLYRDKKISGFTMPVDFKIDIKKAYKYYKIACELGNKQSCIEMQKFQR